MHATPLYASALALSSDEAIVLMEEQMGAEIAKLRAELSVVSGAVVEGAEGAASPLAATVRGLVARLTETPTNFHQATVFFLAADAPEDEAMGRRAPLLYAGSLAMVGLQSATAGGVLIGTVLPACATSDQCGAGTWCKVGWTDRCDYCGRIPLGGDEDEDVVAEEGERGAELRLGLAQLPLEAGAAAERLDVGRGGPVACVAHPN